MAKNALVSLGLLIVFLILAWPSALLLFLLYCCKKKYDYDVSSSILSESSAAVTVVTVIIISTTHVHLKLLVSHPSYLCLNRRLFQLLRIPLPPLLMLIYRSEMLRRCTRKGEITAKVVVNDQQRQQQESYNSSENINIPRNNNAIPSKHTQICTT